MIATQKQKFRIKPHAVLPVRSSCSSAHYVLWEHWVSVPRAGFALHEGSALEQAHGLSSRLPSLLQPAIGCSPQAHHHLSTALVTPASGLYSSSSWRALRSWLLFPGSSPTATASCSLLRRLHTSSRTGTLPRGFPQLLPQRKWVLPPPSGPLFEQRLLPRPHKPHF